MPDKVKDILIYAHYAPPRPSASATRMLSLARYLKRKGFTVKLLTSQPGPSVHEGYQIIRCRGRWGLGYALWQYRVCSILVSSPPGTPAAEVAMVARLLGYRVIVDIRDPFVSEALAVGDLAPGVTTYLKQCLEKSLFFFAHGISYVSEPLKLMMEKYFGRPHVSQVIAPNGIDRNVFHRNPVARQKVREEMGLKEEPLFVYVGILGGKALDEAFEALVPVLRQGPKLLVVAVLDEYSEPIRTRLQQLLVGHGVDSQVMWRFNVDTMEVARLLNACDIGINPLPPSRSYCLPVKTFEYLACGVYPLCFAGDDSALLSLFPDRKNGLLCTNWGNFSAAACSLAQHIDTVRAQAADRAMFAEKFDREQANETLAGLLLQQPAPR